MMVVDDIFIEISESETCFLYCLVFLFNILLFFLIVSVPACFLVVNVLRTFSFNSLNFKNCTLCHKINYLNKTNLFVKNLLYLISFFFSILFKSSFLIFTFHLLIQG